MLNGISKSFYINLDKRKDRRDHIIETLPFYADRFPAIDAKTLTLDERVKNIFGDDLYKLTKAEIACSLSHYSLWKKLTEDDTAENYLILEDDVVFEGGFVNFWNEKFSEKIPEDYNVIYLGGCQPWNKPNYHKVLKLYNEYFANIKTNDFFIKGNNYWHMNAQSYIISKKGAKLLCKHMESGGSMGGSAQDVFVLMLLSDVDPDSVFHLYPLMSRQIHEENDNPEKDKNSDIRFATEKFGKCDTEERMKLIWQFDPNTISQCYERDWIRELFSEVELDEVIDCKFEVMLDNSIIVYNDIWKDGEGGKRNESLYNYLDRVSQLQNVSIIHLGDEFTHAKTEHYSKFKNVIRTTYNESVAGMSNVMQVPLGYKQGFHD